MEDIIKKILDIDKITREATENTDELYSDAKNKIDKNISAIQLAEIQKIKKRIEKYRKTELKKTEIKLQDRKNKNRAVLASMNERVKTNSDIWVENIVNRTLTKNEI